MGRGCSLPEGGSEIHMNIDYNNIFHIIITWIYRISGFSVTTSQVKFIYDKVEIIQNFNQGYVVYFSEGVLNSSNMHYYYHALCEHCQNVLLEVEIKIATRFKYQKEFNQSIIQR